MRRSERRREMKKKTWQPIIISVICLIVLVITAGAIYAYSMLGKVAKNDLNLSDADLGISDEIKAESSNEIMNIAFFGIDNKEKNGSGRSDTIMIISIDKDNQSIKVTSLMRDMYVPIPGHGSNRINAAYAVGGVPLAIKTINTDFGLDIRNYVSVDIYALEKLIDKVGGLQIKVTPAEVADLNKSVREMNYYTGTTVAEVKGSGLLNLNGRQAVAYSRIRNVGDGDYGRTERQRDVLEKLFAKIKSQGITKLPSTISSMLPYVETSLSNSEILSLASDIATFNTDKLLQFRLPVDGTFQSKTIDDMAVLVPNMAQNKEKLRAFIYGNN